VGLAEIPTPLHPHQSWVQLITYIQSLLTVGSLSFPSDVAETNTLPKLS